MMAIKDFRCRVGVRQLENSLCLAIHVQEGEDLPDRDSGVAPFNSGHSLHMQAAALGGQALCVPTRQAGPGQMRSKCDQRLVHLERCRMSVRAFCHAINIA
jgi:hypothetical protein